MAKRIGPIDRGATKFGTYIEIFKRLRIKQRPEEQYTVEDESELGAEQSSQMTEKQGVDNVVHFGKDTVVGQYAEIQEMLDEDMTIEELKAFIETHPEAIALLQADNEKSRELRKLFERKMEQLLRSMQPGPGPGPGPGF